MSDNNKYALHVFFDIVNYCWNRISFPAITDSNIISTTWFRYIIWINDATINRNPIELSEQYKTTLFKFIFNTINNDILQKTWIEHVEKNANGKLNRWLFYLTIYKRKFKAVLLDTLFDDAVINIFSSVHRPQDYIL